MIYLFNGKKVKLSKVRLFRKNFDINSDSWFDYDNYFGELIVVDTGSGYKELLTGTRIPVASFIDESDYHQGVWEHIPCGAVLAQEDRNELTEDEIVLYIRLNEINGFSDRLYLFIQEAKKARFEHFKAKLAEKIRIRK